MLKYNFILLLILFISIGCDYETELYYDDDTLVKVLKDMLIAEGASTRVGNQYRDSLNSIYYGQIFKIHRVDSLKFSKDLNTMGEDPAHSIKIYSQVEKELEADQIKAKQEKVKK